MVMCQIFVSEGRGALRKVRRVRVQGLGRDNQRLRAGYNFRLVLKWLRLLCAHILEALWRMSPKPRWALAAS